jgi:alkylation response protein AidB-like acyl-CoA dehydrogenase
LPPVDAERRAELVARVRELGPTFAERAPEYDRDAAFPTANWADLREAGFLALCIPEEHGGLGADFATYARVSEELGRWDGSTALTFNMHTATMLLTGQIADELALSTEDRAVHDERRAKLWQGVVEEGHIHAQPFSEGLAAGATVGVGTMARPVDGGWSVTGHKIFASLSEAADSHNVICKAEGEEQIRFLGIPADAEGLRIEGDWDPLGMRGTISKNLVMEDVFVPAEREYLPPGAFDQMAERWPFFYLTLSFTFLGLTRAAIEFTRDYLSGVSGPGDRRAHPQKQAGWAQMHLAHEQAEALLYRVVDAAGPDPTPEQLRRAWTAQVTVMETAPEVASLAIRVCGGRSLLRPQALERIYRDARCGATMLPWSVETCLDRLGRAGLLDEEAPA